MKRDAYDAIHCDTTSEEVARRVQVGEQGGRHTGTRDTVPRINACGYNVVPFYDHTMTREEYAREVS